MSRITTTTTTTALTPPPADPMLERQGALMQNILSTIARVAVSDLSVRIVGEHGVGKEWLARMIHAMSARAGTAFVCVDCKALPAADLEQTVFGSESVGPSGREVRPGLLELSRGGTMYFTAMAALPLPVRQRLVGAFERSHCRRVGGHEDVYFNVRAIEGITMAHDESRLRGQSSRYRSLRLGQVCINLPPLRERKDDIPFLAGHFLAQAPGAGRPAACGLTPEALELCAAYDWPGNVQELRDAVESAAVLSGTGDIGPEHLPPALRRQSAESGGRGAAAPAQIPAEE